MAYTVIFETNEKFVEFMKKLCDEYNGLTGTKGKIKYMSSGTMSKLTTANMKTFKSWCPSAWTSGSVEKHISPFIDKDGYYGADCSNMYKGVFWGLDTSIVKDIDKYTPNGPGVKRKSNGVGDLGANALFNICNDISTDMKHIIPGEMIWMNGHIGMYYGKIKNIDYVIDVTISQGGLALNKMCNQPWKKHGKCPLVGKYILSEEVFNAKEFNEYFNKKQSAILMKNGSKGDDVALLQEALNCANKRLGLNASKLEVDGVFGSLTNDMVNRFKKYYSITEENVGICTLGRLGNM